MTEVRKKESVAHFSMPEVRPQRSFDRGIMSVSKATDTSRSE